MRFFAKTRKEGQDDIVVANVTSVSSVRGMLIVKWGINNVYTYNDNDLEYWEVSVAS